MHNREKKNLEQNGLSLRDVIWGATNKRKKMPPKRQMSGAQSAGGDKRQVSESFNTSGIFWYMSCGEPNCTSSIYWAAIPYTVQSNMVAGASLEYVSICMLLEVIAHAMPYGRSCE